MIFCLSFHSIEHNLKYLRGLFSTFVLCQHLYSRYGTNQVANPFIVKRRVLCEFRFTLLIGNDKMSWRTMKRSTLLCPRGIAREHTQPRLQPQPLQMLKYIEMNKDRRRNRERKKTLKMNTKLHERNARWSSSREGWRYRSEMVVQYVHTGPISDLVESVAAKQLD